MPPILPKATLAQGEVGFVRAKTKTGTEGHRSEAFYGITARHGHHVLAQLQRS